MSAPVFSVQALAEGVREAMESAGLTTRDLSERTGIALPTLHRLLAGHGRTFEVSELAAISEHVGLTPLELAARSITPEAADRLGVRWLITSGRAPQPDRCGGQSKGVRSAHPLH